MVADKSKFDKVLIDQPQCENVSKNSTNLGTSQSSSSDESLKSKSENGGHSDQSFDSSDKNESGDERHKIFNSTYLCPKSISLNNGEIDRTIEKVEQYPNLSVLKTADNTVEWKYSSSSYMQNLDITQWSDLKLENVSIEDSFDAKEMVDDSILTRIRNYIVDYQALRGTSPEEYTFSTLIRVLGQATGRCLFALFYVVLNIAPAVVEIFLHIVRFILDKVTDIKTTETVQQVIMKMSVFTAQMVCIYICLVFIFGFIVWPVIRMAFGILTKIMLYD